MAGPNLTAISPSFPPLVVEGVEGAVDSVIALMQSRLNSVIDKLQAAYTFPTGTADVPHVMPNRYYNSEAIQELEPPAVFVLAEHTIHDLAAGQNFDYMKHEILVVMVVERLDEVVRLVRTAWRMGLAARTVLHDANFRGNHILVREQNYSPIYTRKGEANTRMMRKDVTLRLEVHQFEPLA